jgi:Fe2+ transport system protein B
MKSLIFFGVFIIFNIQFVSGQNGNSPRTNPFGKLNIDSVSQKSANELKQPLNLTNVQVNKIYQLEKEYLTNRTNLPVTLTSVNRKTEIEKLEKRKNADLKKILSSEQLQKYEQLINDRKKLMEDKRKQLQRGTNGG